MGWDERDPKWENLKIALKLHHESWDQMPGKKGECGSVNRDEEDEF